MSRASLWLVSMVSLALSASGCVKATATTATTSPSAPLELELPLYADRSTFTLSAHRGQVVLLDVWATWCEPCRQSLPEYQALAKRLGPKGLAVYTVNVDGEAAATKAIPDFIQETKLSLPVLLDTDARVTEGLLNVKVMPTAFLLDRTGRLRHVHEGYEPKNLPELVTQLEALLAEP